MRIQFITSFATDRECYGTTRPHEVSDEQAMELIRLGIATVELVPTDKVVNNSSGEAVTIQVEEPTLVMVAGQKPKVKPKAKK